MATGTVCIGNSDDKLTQVEWSEYVSKVNELIRSLCPQIYFAGFSETRAPWQNACWVFAGPEVHVRIVLVDNLSKLAGLFRQDSIAFVLGDTFMIEPT